MSRTPAHYTTPRTSINVAGLAFTREPQNGAWKATVKTKYGEATYTCVKTCGKWHTSRKGFRRNVSMAYLGQYLDLDVAISICEGDHHEGDD